MPYGLINSQDAFQAKMDQILEGLDNMRMLMERARENGVIFNPDKCSLKVDSVMFFGCLYDKNAVQPDPTKVEAIQMMPVPTCL